MILGFPLDYWHRENIEGAIATFGRLLIWEKKDDRHLARIIIKVRVLSVQAVPRFIVVSDGERFMGESCTVQCKILLQDMLGYVPQDEDPVPPQDEDPVPDLPDDQEPPFNFFGFGQQAVQQGFHQLANAAANNGDQVDGPQAAEWGMWPQPAPDVH